MENNNSSTQNIIKDISDLNHSIDLSNHNHEHIDSKKHKTKSKVKRWIANKTVISIVIFAIISAYAIWATIYFVTSIDYQKAVDREHEKIIQILKNAGMDNKDLRIIVRRETQSSVRTAYRGIEEATANYTGNLSWTDFNESTPQGYGLMVILYLLYLYALIYYYLLKPYALPVINKYLWIPGVAVLKKIKYGSILFYILLIAATLAYLVFDTRDDKSRLIPILGLTVFLLVGFAFSAQHKYVPWNTVAWGIILQFTFGFLTIRWEIGRNVLATFSDHVNTFLDYGVEAAAFTYGDFLVNEKQVFAFRALSVIFFIGFVVNLLYYYGLMQKFVNMLGEFLQYIMGTSICESVNSVAVAFVGMSEGPMMLRPYLKHLTDSELHSMMLAGFASVSGSTFAAYISYGARAQDLITASIMSAPSALCFSKLLYPETEEVKIKREDVHMVEIEYSSAMDAASKGATDAFHLIAAIISGVTATLAFVYFINGILTWLGLLVGFTDESNMWTLELIAGKVFIPVAWIMGVQWSECEKVAQLIGIKTMVNEFVAFSRMGAMGLSARSKVIATYAICGFSNPGSIGILISTMAALVPEKKENVTRLVFRAFVGGALVCLMTACIAGILMPESALEDNTTNSTTSGTNITTIINTTTSSLKL